MTESMTSSMVANGDETTDVVVTSANWLIEDDDGVSQCHGTPSASVDGDRSGTEPVADAVRWVAGDDVPYRNDNDVPILHGAGETVFVGQSPEFGALGRGVRWVAGHEASQKDTDTPLAVRHLGSHGP